MSTDLKSIWDIKCTIEIYSTCLSHHPQEPQQPLQPTPAPQTHLNISVLTSSTLATPRFQSFIKSLHPNTTLKENACHEGFICRTWHFRVPFAPRMAHHLQMHYLLNFQEIVNLIKTQVHPGIPDVMAKRSCCEDHQRISYPCKVLWPESIISPLNILQHTYQCTSIFLYQSALCTTVPQHIWNTNLHAAPDCD